VNQFVRGPQTQHLGLGGEEQEQSGVKQGFITPRHQGVPERKTRRWLDCRSEKRQEPRDCDGSDTDTMAVEVVRQRWGAVREELSQYGNVCL
jgi:hypothetical protein